MRGTFTKDNLDFVQDVLHIAQLGFQHLSIEPVVAEAECGYALDEGDRERIYQEYEALAEVMKDPQGHPFLSLYGGLGAGALCIQAYPRMWWLGDEYAAVTPDGDVYPPSSVRRQRRVPYGKCYGEELG